MKTPQQYRQETEARRREDKNSNINANIITCIIVLLIVIGFIF